MATYVIGDIHGEFEQLKILLETMKFNDNEIGGTRLNSSHNVISRMPSSA